MLFPYKNAEFCELTQPLRKTEAQTTSVAGAGRTSSPTSTFSTHFSTHFYDRASVAKSLMQNTATAFGIDSRTTRNQTRPNNNMRLAHLSIRDGTAHTDFQLCHLCGSSVLTSSFEWHIQKCVARTQQIRHKRQGWISSTYTSRLPKETHIKTWTPTHDHLSKTIQSTQNYSAGGALQKSRTEFIKCEICDGYVNSTGYDFHTRKCSLRDPAKKSNGAQKLRRFATGNFHRSPMDMKGNPNTFRASVSAQRTWWHQLSDQKTRTRRSGPIAVTQCDICNAIVLSGSFEIHRQKCRSIWPSELLAEKQARIHRARQKSIMRTKNK
mmetsp:Transcript_15695/g.28182  ORF Transcript_15695/g.28182 Transcript_15695/m.28182 type:complete len:324 (-) Transcript_15695:191-1162(-)